MTLQPSNGALAAFPANRFIIDVFFVSFVFLPLVFHERVQGIFDHGFGKIERVHSNQFVYNVAFEVAP